MFLKCNSSLFQLPSDMGSILKTTCPDSVCIGSFYSRGSLIFIFFYLSFIFFSSISWNFHVLKNFTLQVLVNSFMFFFIYQKESKDKKSV